MDIHAADSGVVVSLRLKSVVGTEPTARLQAIRPVQAIQPKDAVA